ncbi:MAG: hypothetical protein HDKAJFGB_01394 [Anaerolineae bacterium]|nr:hypothetical protein [Anaerolineae bacterium]MDL1896641.1 YIP1 family protein [Anaerolineae bacterium CFX7]RIK33637.1 MAG: hypothetical protein DCC52_02720 [Chloroflexota bacterium]
MNRLAGIVTLRVATYREIADDPNATRPALWIVALVSLFVGAVSGLVRSDPNDPQRLATFDALSVLEYALIGLAFGLIAWFVGAWVLAFVARWFGGKTNTKEMLRVTGYVEIFALVGVLSLVTLWLPALTFVTTAVLFVVSILRLLGYIIGIREAAEFSTGNAIVTAIFALLVAFLIRGAAELLARFLDGIV